MSIFNSLGSSYDLSFALKALLPNKDCDLKKYLEERYGGKAILLFKGRQAITLALNLLNTPKNSEIAINGFTCYAVYKAIEEAGHKPVLIDISSNNLNFSAEGLKKKLKENPGIKAVIIQNTLGYPCEIENISEICKDNDIILIEDLAHSAGGKYQNGKEMGTVGDFIILSFSQDKIMDGVTGGALIIRNIKYQKEKIDNFESPPLKKELTDKFYPLFTLIIRKTYAIKFGHVIHFLLKSIHLLSTPMDENLYKKTLLPNRHCNLIITTFKNLDRDQRHRRLIAKIYSRNLNKKMLSDSIIRNIDLSTNLRFPIFTEDRENLINYLKKYNIFISDIWYDAPIAPKKYLSKTGYKGECPNAERLSSLILNLPTHKEVLEKDALFISERVNEWLKLQ